MKPEHVISPGNLRAAQAARLSLYPHMGPADARVWDAALKLHLVQFDSVEYAVRLGGAGALAMDKAHTHRKMYETLLRKRVDVVGYSRAGVTVIEVKPYGGFAALGQCLGYLDLWQRERPGPEKVQALCVCAILDPDLGPTFAKFGVRVVALPPDEAQHVLAPSRHV